MTDAATYQEGYEDGAEAERAAIAKELAQLTTDGERLAYVRGVIWGYRLTQEGPATRALSPDLGNA